MKEINTMSPTLFMAAYSPYIGTSNLTISVDVLLISFQFITHLIKNSHKSAMYPDMVYTLHPTVINCGSNDVLSYVGYSCTLLCF